LIVYKFVSCVLHPHIKESASVFNRAYFLLIIALSSGVKVVSQY
jgi:hypothetical protein